MAMQSIGPLSVYWGKQTYVMGIINATPDSFSGDGLLDSEKTVQAALAQARRFVAEGAHILDIGGESTRPGSQPVSSEVELLRVIPVIEAIAKEFSVAISVDTYKANVARAALDAGAHLINDVWGGRMDPSILDLAAERGVPIVLMHNRSRPKNVMQQSQLGGRYEGIHYENLLGDVVQELIQCINMALKAGVKREQILIDPGIGFGKSIKQNLELLNRSDELRVLGYPLLIGASRKSFIGYTLNLPYNERVEGTAATVAIAIARGADVVRVHDVEVMARVAKMTDAIVRGKN